MLLSRWGANLIDMHCLRLAAIEMLSFVPSPCVLGIQFFCRLWTKIPGSAGAARCAATLWLARTLLA